MTTRRRGPRSDHDEGSHIATFEAQSHSFSIAPTKRERSRKTRSPAALHKPPAPDEQRARPRVQQGTKESAERTIKSQLHNELLERLDIKRLTINQVREDELRERVKNTLNNIIREVANRLPAGIEPRKLVKELYDEAVGLGPLEDLLQDPEITEIMVNGPGKVYVERDGKIQRTAALAKPRNNGRLRLTGTVRPT